MLGTPYRTYIPMANKQHPHNPEVVMPYDDTECKSTQVRRMFDNIAPTYDRMNRLMTFGLDKGWRRKAMKMLGTYTPKSILDVATGTGDLPFLMHKMLLPDSITGIDLSEGMLDIARRKCAERNLQHRITFEQQDCLALTFPDDSFDAVTVSFGVRNFQQLRKGFAEMYRVLRPGGVLMVIELSSPEHFPFDLFYRIYTRNLIPLAGRLFTRDKYAYTYLPRSVEAVPQGEEMLAIFRECGFRDCRLRRLTFGVCSIYIGHK